ncbi:Gp138 family membrane-puncturing spike protein [Pandoraea apista]|uniref:Gp138 family membrane-puncturing spike protein n=1 Tax=Pandoraea apista TaxID=93218 RepID=UPI002F925512
MIESGYVGLQQPSDTIGEFNATRSVVLSLLSQMFTATEARVVACTNSGDLSPVGFVDVQPLVNQLDGAAKSMPHNILHRLPYFRLQGGADAVIIDPKVGDIGIVIFADRDISAVNNVRGQANPGSGRRFDMADGMYIGGVLNGTPNQYVRVSSEGIDIVSPTRIRFSAPNIVLQATESIGLTAGTQVTNSAPVVEIDGQMTQGEGPQGGNASMQGPLNVANDVTASGTSVHGHTHTAKGANAVTSAPNP